MGPTLTGERRFVAPIYLIRHAESVLNATQVVQFPDTPLSDRGHGQAIELAASLRKVGIMHVASSDYLRARITAQVICAATQITLTMDPLLRERNLGTLRGRPYSEVREYVFSETYDPDQGESWTAFNARVDALWTWVRDLHKTLDGALAVVTHGLVCRTLARRHLTVRGNGALRFPNASMTAIDPDPPWCAQPLDATDASADPFLETR